MAENISRRTLAKGAAWATPAVTLASVTPAMAASPLGCPKGISETVENVFTSHLAAIKQAIRIDPSKIRLRVWFAATSHSNGGGAYSSTINLVNVGSDALDLSRYPIEWDIAFRDVTTSPAINGFVDEMQARGRFNKNNVKRYETTGSLTDMFAIPWAPAGLGNNWDTSVKGNLPYTDPLDETDESLISSCRSTSERRSYSFSTSYGRFYNARFYNDLGNLSVSKKVGTCGGETGQDVAYVFGQTRIPGPTSEGRKTGIAMLGMQWQDGRAAPPNTDRYHFTSIGIRPRGFIPPSFKTVLDLLEANNPKYPKQQWANGSPTGGQTELFNCAYPVYQARLKRWREKAEGLLGMGVEFVGWAKGYDNVPKKWGKEISGDGFVWSHKAGNFFSAGGAPRAGGGSTGSTTSPSFDPLGFIKTTYTDGPINPPIPPAPVNGISALRACDGIF